jgi:hypothetical protein
MFAGLPDRLQKEISALAHNAYEVKVSKIKTSLFAILVTVRLMRRRNETC